jgi:glycosyltransferase involved in cell wall biosynthesis
MKKIAIIFPKDSEWLFDKNSNRTFWGANVQLYLIAKELNNNKEIAVSSIIPNYKNINFDDQDKFNLVKSYNETDTIIVKSYSLYKTLKSIKPDVLIQRWLTLFSCLLAFYCKIVWIKFVFMFAHDVETLWLSQSEKKKIYLFDILLKKSYLLITQNNIQSNNLLNINKQYINKIHILKKGLALNKLETKQKKYDWIWVGRAEKWKNPEIFLDLAIKNPEQIFLMVMPKTKNKEKYFNKIKDEIRGISNIKFIEFASNKDIYKYLNQSKVFCFTSDQEWDWPMTVLESCSQGVSILSYKLNYDDLIDSYNWWMFCNNIFRYFNEKFHYLIEKNNYEQYWKNAYNYVVDKHDITKNVNKLLELIKKI